MTLIMTVAAVPFGAITAIYLAEYASERSILAKTIRFAVKTLAVVPSIIFGLFGLGFFIKFVGLHMDNLFIRRGTALGSAQYSLGKPHHGPAYTAYRNCFSGRVHPHRTERNA